MVHLKKLSRTEAAYHEAGHATIGRVLSLVCGEATIKPNLKTGLAGSSVCYGAYLSAREWSLCRKIRGPKAAWHAEVMGLMA
jgi:hypothetical protein